MQDAQILSSRRSAIPSTTHDVDKFLNLAHTLGTDLTHLERYERTELIALQNNKNDNAEMGSEWVLLVHNAPWQPGPRESGVLSHLSGEQVYS